MPNNFVLIDLENVQPESLDLLAPDLYRVLVFVGASQHKLSFDIAAAIQKLGESAEYIRISGNGPNALDFHIAYYIGVHATVDPAAQFYIVSKDTGFDPLIRHLKTKQVIVQRVKSIGEILPAQAGATIVHDERVRYVIDKFAQPKVTKPRTLKTLARAVNAFFQKQLSDEEVAAITDALVQRGVISVTETKVTYASAGDV